MFVLLLADVLIFDSASFKEGWEAYFTDYSAEPIKWRPGLGLVASPTGLRIRGQDTDLNDDGWPDILVSDGEWYWVRWIRVVYGPDMGPDTIGIMGPGDSVTTDGCALADLDYDGVGDLIYCVMDAPANEETDAMIYWGFGPDGYERVDTLKFGLHRNQELALVADLDSDGWQDIVLPIFRGDNGEGEVFRVASVIFWGSPEGYGSDTTLLPGGSGPHGASIGDLNHDGLLDVVIGNTYGSLPRYTVIYWNPGAREDTWRDTFRLNAHGVYGLTLADMNRDGWLDIVLANRWDGKDINVFYNHGGAFNRDPDVEIDVSPNWGASAVWVEDFDGDGWLDIAIARKTLPPDTFTPYLDSAAVVWSDGCRFERVTQLVNIGGYGLFADDYDLDGDLDLVVLNKEGTGPRETAKDTVSFVYINQGPPHYFTEDQRIEFRTYGAGRSRSHDYIGNVYDRARRHWFLLPERAIPGCFRVDSVVVSGELANAKVRALVWNGKSWVSPGLSAKNQWSVRLALEIRFDPRYASLFNISEVRVFYTRLSQWTVGQVEFYDVLGRKLEKPKRGVNLFRKATEDGWITGAFVIPK